MYRHRVILFVFILVLGCKPIQVATTSVSPSKPYYEDITVHHIAFSLPDEIKLDKPEEIKETSIQIEPKYHIAVQLDSINKMIAQKNREKRYVDGYTIQIYSGTSRETANQFKSKAYTIGNGLLPLIEYDQPNYKVKIGKYFTRLEAYKQYILVKREFSQALLLPERILMVND